MKRLFCLLLIVLIFAVMLASCGSAEQSMNLNADEITQITATDSIYSSYLYVIEDKEGIKAIAELCNGLRFVPTDEVSYYDLLGDTLYSLIFSRDKSDSEASLAGVHISPRGYLYFMDYEHMYDNDLSVCRLTSGFDEEKLQSLLKKYDGGGTAIPNADEVDPLFSSDYANEVFSSTEK